MSSSSLHTSSSQQPSHSSTLRKRGLQGWLMEKAQSPWGVYVMGMVSFAESSFFPLPPDLMLIPMLVADKTRAFRLAAICTITSVLGALVGYLLGYYLIDTIGQLIIDTYGLKTEFANFQKAFQEYGFWFILMKGLTPIPFKLMTIASGATHLHLGWFMGACLLIRSFRFYLLSAIFWYYGEGAKSFYENNFKLFIGATLVVIVGGFFVLRII